jgi:hypothetical protein
MDLLRVCERTRSYIFSAARDDREKKDDVWIKF